MRTTAPTKVLGGGAVVGTAGVAGLAKAANTCYDCGTGGSPSLTYTAQQSDLVNSSHTISVTTKAEHEESFYLSSGRYEHRYKIVTEAVQTDGNQNKYADLSAHEFHWDATNSSSNVDCAQDNDSPYVGAWPDPASADGTAENILEEIIKTVAGELSNKAAVAIPGATIAAELINALSDYWTDPDRKKWGWHYGGATHDIVSHQLTPGFLHSAYDSPSWTTRSVADSLGTKLTFYGGSQSDVYGDPANPSLTGAALHSLSLNGEGTDQSSNGDRKIVQTKGLDSEDFHALPPTTSMTAKERARYGVREPTDAERQSLGEHSWEADIVSVVERFPMTIVAAPGQK